MWFVFSFLVFSLIGLCGFVSSEHRSPSRQTEADLSAEFKQSLSSGFAFQDATFLFHQLNLANEIQPRMVILNLIEETQGLLQKTLHKKSYQTIEFKFSGHLAKALGFADDLKAPVRYRMRIGEGREKLQNALKMLNQVNDVIFQSDIGDPVRSPDSDFQKKINWMIFQRKLFEISGRTYK